MREQIFRKRCRVQNSQNDIEKIWLTSRWFTVFCANKSSFFPLRGSLKIKTFTRQGPKIYQNTDSNKSFSVLYKLRKPLSQIFWTVISGKNLSAPEHIFDPGREPVASAFIMFLFKRVIRSLKNTALKSHIFTPTVLRNIKAVVRVAPKRFFLISQHGVGCVFTAAFLRIVFHLNDPGWF